MSTDQRNFSKKNFNPTEWVSQTEAAKIRAVTRQAISRLVQKGRFRVLRIGGKTFLNKSDVEGFTPKPPGPTANKKPRKRTT